MKIIFFVTIALLSAGFPELYSQTPQAPKLYAHKVVVEEILQTKTYTYLRVKEHIKDIDSIQWMALPLFEPVLGATYYFQGGLPMGEFKSKELGRTFNQILFLGEISSNPEIGGNNLIADVPIAPPDTTRKNMPPPIVHTVVVKEVLQTSGYTYLRVKEGKKELWLAVVKIRAAVGQTFTFDDAATMNDFTSKELKRTFKEILFLAKLTPGPDSKNKESDSKQKKNAKDKEIKIDPVQGSISIAALLENKKSYSGKTVIIKGEVTKYSSNILDKNWLHIKDGTDFSGKSDLTVTTTQKAKIGDTITVQGIIALDKDFGSGYFFDIIMEDATLEIK